MDESGSEEFYEPQKTQPGDSPSNALSEERGSASINFVEVVHAASRESELMDPGYPYMKRDQLRDACRRRGYKMSGRREILIHRLQHPPLRKVVSNRSRAEIVQRLRSMRLVHDEKQEDLSTIGHCLLESLRRGFFNLEDTDKICLEQRLFTGDCPRCSHSIDVHFDEMIWQVDWQTDDRNQEEHKAPIECPECRAALWVSNICSGEPRIVPTRRDLNHCVLCPGLGRCMGDAIARETRPHCCVCGKHLPITHKHDENRMVVEADTDVNDEDHSPSPQEQKEIDTQPPSILRWVPYWQVAPTQPPTPQQTANIVIPRFSADEVIEMGPKLPTWIQWVESRGKYFPVHGQPAGRYTHLTRKEIATFVNPLMREDGREQTHVSTPPPAV